MRDVLRIAGELFDEAWGVRELYAAAQASGYFWSWRTAFGALASLWLIAAILAASLRLTRWLLPNAGLPLRWGSVFCVGMWLSTLGFHALRGVHAFRLPWALLAASLLLAAAIFARGRRSLGWALRRERRALGLLARRVRTSRASLVWGVFAGFAGVLLLRGFVIPPLGWDTVTYHGPRAVQWLQSGRFTFDAGVGPYDFYRHFFAGGEVLTAWAMLPFRSDLLVNLSSFAQWLGVGLASWALARGLGLREPFAGASAAVVMFLPTLQLELNSGYVELPLNAALIQGIALAVVALRRPSAGAIVLCAVALGVAAGIKLPGAPPGVLVAGVLLVRWLFARSVAPRLRFGTLAASLAVAVLPALPWIGRALRDTGYPLSPMPVKLGGVTLGVASSAMQWYAHRPQLTPFTWASEKEALLKVFAPLSQHSESLGSMALIALLVFPAGLIALARRRPLTALALCLAALAPVLAHFSDGMTPVRLLRSNSSSRFLVPTVALVVPISLSWCRRGRWLPQAYTWLLLAYPLAYSVIVLRRGVIDWEHGELVLVGLVLSQLGLLGYWALRRRGLRVGAGVLIAGWLVACLVIQARRDVTRPLAYQRSFAVHGMPRFWTDGIPFVDQPGTAHRLAITGGPDRSSDKWFHYFYMGRRFENTLRYIAPTRDGRVAHFDKNGDLQAEVDRDAWIARLVAAGIGEVLTFPPRSLEQTWMEEAPDRFEKLAGKPDWGLFRLK